MSNEPDKRYIVKRVDGCLCVCDTQDNDAPVDNSVEGLEALLNALDTANKHLKEGNDGVGRAVKLLLEKEKENARLKAEVEHLQNCLGDAHAINAKEELKTWERIENLKAEVERLRKAGDAMADLLSCAGSPPNVVQSWKAAKEGKQS